MEASLARHHRLLRSLVLRYAKAFLLSIVTTITTIVATGLLSLIQESTASDLSNVNDEYVWVALLSLYGCWCLASAFVVRRPVRWIYEEIDNATSYRTQQSLLRFESSALVTLFATSVLNSGNLASFALMDGRSGNAQWMSFTAIVFLLILTGSYVTRVYRRDERPLVRRQRGR